MTWKVDPNTFDGWGLEGWAPTDFDPVARLDASARKVGQVMFHPTASNVLANWLSVFEAAGSNSLCNCKCLSYPKLENDTPSLCRVGGTAYCVLTTTKQIRDLATPEDPRVTLTGHGDAFQSSAFNPTGTLLATTCRDRKLRLFDPAPAPTRDGNIRYYEYESDAPYALSEHKSSDPQRGMCFLPRRALNVAGSSIEPIAFIVPRKADSFQSDIFPPAPSSEPSLSATKFFSGKFAPLRLVNLQDGIKVEAKVDIPAPAPASTRKCSAAAPEPMSARQASVDIGVCFGFGFSPSFDSSERHLQARSLPSMKRGRTKMIHLLRGGQGRMGGRILGDGERVFFPPYYYLLLPLVLKTAQVGDCMGSLRWKRRLPSSAAYVAVACGDIAILTSD
ncbi:hypothetical protein R3P38DRAFT_3350054 [Favolaschia claudopus]|uniref:Uncharacterized protein n=1 Tax=Favolaschia claudopus TaxID=2862362 RepID=A0AAW0CM65_9AGAR